jgi:hypothetical protein
LHGIGRHYRRLRHDYSDDRRVVADEYVFAEWGDNLDERRRSVWRCRFLAGLAGTHCAVSVWIRTDESYPYLDKELSDFNGVFPILVRYPGDLITYAGTSTPPAGFGLHDDAFAAEASDGATWLPCFMPNGWCLTQDTQSQLMAYGAQVSTTSMFVAEFSLLNQTLQACAPFDAYSYQFHLSHLLSTSTPHRLARSSRTMGA